MKIRLTLATLFVLSLIILPLISSAQGWKPNKYYKRTPNPSYIVPAPTGASLWCTRNPHLCYPRMETDPLVDNPCGHCMDSKGNGDGYLSYWELRRWRKRCMVCE